MNFKTFLGVICMISAPALAMACPDLSGNYVCPAYGKSQPESKMQVLQITDEKGVTGYGYKFEFSSEISYSHASDEGIEEQGMRKYCDDQKLYLMNLEGKNKGRAQAHFLDESKNYIVVINGKIIQSCHRSDQ